MANDISLSQWNKRIVASCIRIIATWAAFDLSARTRDCRHLFFRPSSSSVAREPTCNKEALYVSIYWFCWMLRYKVRVFEAWFIFKGAVTGGCASLHLVTSYFIVLLKTGVSCHCPSDRTKTKNYASTCLSIASIVRHRNFQRLIEYEISKVHK